MAEDWATVRADVATALAGAGFPAIVRRTAQAPDSDRPWDVTGGSPVDFTVNVILDDYNRTEVDGTTVQRSDKKVLVDAATVVPSTADLLVVNGQVMQIVSVKTINPGGVALMYEVQARA